MKSKKIIATLLTASLMLSTALVGCGDKKEADKTSDKGQYITLDISEVKTLDSGKATDQMSFTPLTAAMETLTRSKDDKPVEGAAKEWKTSEDGKTWTFTLRDGLKWSDDKALTAKDFEYAWKRILDPTTKSGYATFLFGVKNGEKFNAGEAKIDEVGIKAVDDKTLKIDLEHPIPYFLQLTSFPLLAPLREDIVKASGDKYGTDPSKMVFCGPFTIESWQRGSKMQLKKNPKYWDANTVQLEDVTFQVTKEMSTRYQKFTSNELDAIPLIGDYVKKASEDSKSGKYNFIQEVNPSSFWMLFKQSGKNPNKLLTNAKIRLALSLAIDREAYVKQVYKRGVASFGEIPKGLLIGEKEYRAEVPEPLKKAAEDNKDLKALFVAGLKELGVDPNPSKYTLRYLPQDSDAESKKYAEFFQNQWQSKLGLKITIDPVASFADYLKKTEDGNFEIAMNGWGADYNDPYTFAELFKTGNGNNYGGYSSKEYDDLMAKLINETDNLKRLEIFKQSEELLLVKDAGVAPVFYKDKCLISQSFVKGIQYPSFGGVYELKWTSTADRK